MMTRRKLWHWMTPIQSLVIGFALITLVFAVFFCFPLSSVDHKPISLVDGLFIAASGISTTGLCTIDIGSRMSLTGQIALIILVQMGGIGYMVFILIIAYIIGHRPTLYTKVAFRESLAGISLSDMKKMTVVVFVFTFIFEVLCAVILSLYWAGKYPLTKAVYMGIFHSISGFCTAGFGLLPDNLASIAGSSLVNVTVDITCIAGAIGFFVLYNLYGSTAAKLKEGRFKRLSLHSRLALIITLSLIIFGTAIVLVTEKWHSTPFIQRFMNSFFQAVSASTTTGFNSVDIGAMGTTSLLALIILMFIGASPGSTGGGIKTTTFGILVLAIRSIFKGNPDINLFKKRIAADTLSKSLTIGLIAAFLVIIDVIILTITEKASFLAIVFETVSAFGNVGLSMGITSQLSVIGKLTLLITMFIGRVGPLAIGFSLIGRIHTPAYRYGEESVFVG